MKIKIIHQGNDTGVGGGSLCVAIKTTIKDLTGFKATLTIDGTDFKKEFTDITPRKLAFNITAAESAAMALGYHETSVKITDPNNLSKTIKGDTIFDVRRPQDDD